MANNSHDLIKGLLIASALGGATYLFSPKKEEACENECECSHGSIVVGSLLVGAALGAAAGLLLAPSSGEELREGIGDKYGELREGLGDKYGELREKAEGLLDKIGEKGPQVKRAASAKFDQIAEWATLGLSFLEKLQKRK